MINYDKFAKVEPSVLATLGNLVQPMVYVRGTDYISHLKFETVYKIPVELGLKLLSKLYNSNDDIVKDDKVFFVPKQSATAYKLKDTVTSLGASVAKSYDKANVIVFPANVATRRHWLNTNIDIEAQNRELGNDSLLHFTKNSNVLNTAYKDLYLKHGFKELYDLIESGYTEMICNDIYDLNRCIYNMIPQTDLPVTRSYELTEHLYPNTDSEDYCLVSGYLLNLLYYSAKNKVKLISQTNFFEKYKINSMELNEESVKTILQMLKGSDEDKQLGVMLLCNSDYADKPFYTWYLADYRNVYHVVDSFKRLKDVKHFLTTSNFEKFAGMTGFEFWEYIVVEKNLGRQVFHEDNHAMDFIQKRLEKEYKDRLPESLKRLIQKGLGSSNFVVNLVEQEGVV
jgi:hypothetical protein